MFLIDKTTGEILTVDENSKLSFDSYEDRANKFLLLSVLRDISISRSVKFCHITSIKKASSFHLTTNSLSSDSSNSCFSNRNDNFDFVSKSKLSKSFVNRGSTAHIFKSIENKKAHFGGIVRCSNVWSCPVCSSRIISKRVKILEEINNKHLKNGGSLYLLTLTIPHYKNSSIKKLVKDLTSSYRKLTSRKKYRQFAYSYLIGTVRGFETTYSDRNGFHPHFHIILYLKEFDVLCRAGYSLDKNNSHLVDVRLGQDAFLYISKTGKKWTLADEVTKSFKKKSSSLDSYSSFTPQAILIKYVNSVLENNPNLKMKRLFNEYEKAFHGKNMLSISRSLYKAFNISEISDSDLNNQFEDSSELLASLSLKDWKLIYKNNLFADLLTIAENGDGSNVALFLDSLETLEKNKFNIKDIFKQKIAHFHSLIDEKVVTSEDVLFSDKIFQMQREKRALIKKKSFKEFLENC